MPRLAIVFSALLILLGVASYLGTGRASPTALIPAFFGLALLGAGLLGLKERLRRHAMHLAALLALVGVLGTLGGLFRFFALLAGQAVERPAAVYAQALMAVLCLVFLALCIRSFVQARRRRKEVSG